MGSGPLSEPPQANRSKVEHRGAGVTWRARTETRVSAPLARSIPGSLCGAHAQFLSHRFPPLCVLSSLSLQSWLWLSPNAINSRMVLLLIRSACANVGVAMRYFELRVKPDCPHLA